MGARPVAAFLSLALPRAVAANARWVNRFVDGMLALAKDHGITLAGGDTSESPTEHVLADIMLLGAAPTGTALRRSGARPGDVLYCTGTLGGSAQELVQLGLSPESYRNVKRGEDLFPHLYPEPRVAVGMALRERGIATACIDLSDGLSTDLAHLCTASGVAAEVDINALPAARRLRGAEANFSNRCVHHGGEDYELLFTARAETKVPKKIAGVKITRIGNIIARTPTSPQMVLHRQGWISRTTDSRRLGALQRMTGFAQTWSATILREPPLIAPARQYMYPQHVPGEEEAMERGALRLLVKPSEGAQYLLTCALGFREPSLPTGTFACPAPESMLAVAGGYAYLADTRTPERCVHLPLRPVTRVLAAREENLLLLAGFHTVAAVGVHGLLWETAKLSWEGLQLGAIRDGQLHGTGWNMISNRDVPFTIDLRTGAHTGGGFSQ